MARTKGNNSGKQKKPPYADLVTAFDIETTKVPNTDHSIMYIWQWAFGRDLVVYGRTWTEFKQLCSALVDPLAGRLLVTWVHNLSYEFQFISDPKIHHFEAENVFALKNRKILKATLNPYGIEMRCSYLHSNMALSKYLRSLKVEDQKLELDYSVTRWPWTPLTDDELAYCVNDVLGLVEAVETEMKKDNDTLYTIPLTSTGYVRREAKAAMRTSRIAPTLGGDYDFFLALRRAFRGGNTHANRAFAGRILENVKSYDRSSSYPDVIMNCKFPMRPFSHDGPISIQTAGDLIRHGKCLLVLVRAFQFKLKDDLTGCPFLPVDRVSSYARDETVIDNGRILKSTYAEFWCTDPDLEIFQNQYIGADIQIVDSYSSTYGRLPAPLREITREYYKRKTELKGGTGPDDDYYYMKSKNKLNSIYGMMVENPMRDVIQYDEVYSELFRESPPDIETYDSVIKKSWLAYAWGVWVTAWARYRLQEGINLVEQSPGAWFVYADTDSVKYMGDVDWSGYNNARIADSKKSGAFATDRNGKVHYMGVYEFDGQYDRFRTWGAKKYAYEKHGKLEVTISGVVKDLGGKELGSLERFEPGFVFREAGGAEIRYNDHPETEPMIIEGHELVITRNALIRESTYEVGITNDYMRIIKYASQDNVQLTLED